MNRKINKLLQPSFRLYFACLILFALLSAAFCWQLALVELALVLLLALYSRQAAVRRRRELNKYLDSYTGNVDTATKDTMINSPLPMVLFRPESGDIIWTNERFLRLSDQREHLYDSTLSALIPGFDTRWLMEGKNQCPTEVSYSGRRFLVYGHLVRTGGRGGGFLATTYWVDVTELCLIRDQYQATRPVAAVLLLDNYEDLLKNLSENERSTIMAEIDSRIERWVADTGGILRRYQRERYLFVFEQRHLGRFIESKFDILDAIHQVVNPSGMNASLSIGVGTDGDSFRELLDFANLSVDMALSRGGDQAVIRNKFTFEFYGGRSKETEKRTKVKSRVMANALSSLVSDSSQVFIMGHKAPDNDAVGAAAGVCALCRKNGVPAHIIREAGPTPSQVLIDRLQQLPEYHDCFLSAQDALLIADNRSLVVVVDTNRPEQVQALEVLQSCNRVAVIDHHRRAATYIEGAALNYHEPYASSLPSFHRAAAICDGARPPSAGGGRGPAGRHRAGHQELYHAYRGPHLRGSRLPPPLRGGHCRGKEAFRTTAGTSPNTPSSRTPSSTGRHRRGGGRRPVGRVTAPRRPTSFSTSSASTPPLSSPRRERVNISAGPWGHNVQLILESWGGGNAAAARAGLRQVGGRGAQELARAIDQYLEEE